MARIWEKVLTKFSTEQLEQMLALYQRQWGPMTEWTDDRLPWAVEIEKRLREKATEDTAEVLEYEIAPDRQVHALIPA